MAANLFNLPSPAVLLPLVSPAALAIGAGWYDQIYIPQPGWPASPQTFTLAMSTSSAVLSGIGSEANIVTGMPVTAELNGLAPGTTVESVNLGSGQVTLSQAPIANLGAVTVNFLPPPLDLSGINFRSQIRLTPGDQQILFEASTINGYMTNSGAAGYFGYNAPPGVLENVAWPAGIETAPVPCVMDIAADDGTNVLDLLAPPFGPATINVSYMVTR